MDLDRILGALNARGVDYLLIGGVNFLLRHEPVLTFDMDIWIEDTPENHLGLSDEDMLQCQLALPEREQKLDRIRSLRKAIEERHHG